MPQNKMKKECWSTLQWRRSTLPVYLSLLCVEVKTEQMPKITFSSINIPITKKQQNLIKIFFFIENLKIIKQMTIKKKKKKIIRESTSCTLSILY